jgi:SET and MYND domain-containing protein
VSLNFNIYLTSDPPQFVTNTFTITSPSLDPIGASVSPVVALINHSCDPNAVIVFPRASASPAEEEPLMHVIALRSIEANEEVDSRCSRQSRPAYDF